MSSPTKSQSLPQGEALSPLIYYCCICLLPLSSATSVDQKRPDFWLTSCGHIICTNHLFEDGVPHDHTTATHSCPYCNNSGVSLASVIPRQTPVGLRDYFTPHNELLENITGALRFQHENVLRVATHYKGETERLQGKLENQKSVLLRVKDELVEARELKKEKPLLDAEIARLRAENEDLRRQIPGAQEAYEQQQAQQRQQDQFISNNSNPSPSGLSNGAGNTPQKRKAELDPQDEGRVRDFRRELNGRFGMPPPPQLPQPVNRVPPPQENTTNFVGQFERQSSPHISMPPPPLPRQENPPRNYEDNLAPAYGRQEQYEQFQQQPIREPNRQQLPQTCAHRPPPTPQKPFIPQRPQSHIPQTPYVNAPFRTPLVQPRVDNHYSASKFNSPTIQQPSLYKLISPTGNPGGRLSLAPQTSSGRPSNGVGDSSPFFSRPSSVAGGYQGRPETRNVFAGEFFQRPESLRGGSVAPSRGSDRVGGGGLGSLLSGNTGFVERPGLRRVVRRE